MINVICGYSGAGKTTYVLENKNEKDIIIDTDELKKCFRNFNNNKYIKELQILIADFFIKRGINIWYITCYPNFEELELFKDKEVNYIWINTIMDKANENVIKRNRREDIKDIEKIKKFNIKIKEKYYSSEIDFKIIDVFESDERW